MARTLVRCVLVCFTLVTCDSVAVADVEHVIHVSVDGLRGDSLDASVRDSPSLYPNFGRLVAEGATTFNGRTDFARTNTIPNHTTMLTGRPVLQPTGDVETLHHGYTNNDDPRPSDTLHTQGNPQLDYVASVFDVVHDNGLSTALYASKAKFIIYDQSYNLDAGAEDVIAPDNGRDKIDTYAQKSSGNPANAAELQSDFLVDLAEREYNYSFLHYRDPDSAGHDTNWGSATWDTSVQNVDAYLGQLMDLVATDAGLADETVIIVTSDHGGTSDDHQNASNPANFTIPVFVWGAGVAEGADLYALNIRSRLEPGRGRPSYSSPLQPIRNGDTGNLALDLLGLSPVPGSIINAQQDLSVKPDPDLIVPSSPQLTIPHDEAPSFVEANMNLTLLAGGALSDRFRALGGSTVNVLGGSVGDGFLLDSGSTANLYGGTIGDEFIALDGSSVNLFVIQFALDGEDMSDAVVIGESLRIDARRHTSLSGVLKDGSPFHFELSTVPGGADFFAARARVTLTMVPEPASNHVVLCALVAGWSWVRRPRDCRAIWRHQ